MIMFEQSRRLSRAAALGRREKTASAVAARLRRARAASALGAYALTSGAPRARRLRQRDVREHARRRRAPRAAARRRRRDLRLGRLSRHRTSGQLQRRAAGRAGFARTRPLPLTASGQMSKARPQVLARVSLAGRRAARISYAHCNRCAAGPHARSGAPTRSTTVGNGGTCTWHAYPSLAERGRQRVADDRGDVRRADEPPGPRGPVRRRDAEALVGQQHDAHVRRVLARAGRLGAVGVQDGLRHARSATAKASSTPSGASRGRCCRPAPRRARR